MRDLIVAAIRKVPRGHVSTYGAIAKAALVQEFDFGVDAGGQRALATADKDRPEEQMALVDQPLNDRLPGELRPTDRDV